MSSSHESQGRTVSLHFLVLLEEERNCPVSYVRIIHHLQHAPSDFRFTVCVLPGEADVARAILPQVSGLLLARNVSSTAADITALAKQAGLPVVYDLDDYLWKLPAYAPGDATGDGIDAVLKNTTHLLTPSENLGNFVRERFPHISVQVQSNACDLATQHLAKRRVVKAVMANSDFFRLPAMRREFFTALRDAARAAEVKLLLHYFSNDVPEHWTDDSWLQIVWCGVRAYPAYRILLDAIEPDLGLVPLATDHFSRFKSVVKYAEFGFHGIAGVYSRTEPYLGFIEEGVDGWLSPNSPAEWRAAMTAVLRLPPEEIRLVGKQASVRARKKFDGRAVRAAFYHHLRATGARPKSYAEATRGVPDDMEFTYRPAYNYVNDVIAGLRWERDTARQELADLRSELQRLRNEVPAQGHPQ
jgi:hypothetical protein